MTDPTGGSSSTSGSALITAEEDEVNKEGLSMIAIGQIVRMRYMI